MQSIRSFAAHQKVSELNNNRTIKRTWMNQDEYDWHIVHTDSMPDISPEFGEVEVNAHNYMLTPIGNSFFLQGPNGPNDIIVGLKYSRLHISKLRLNYDNYLISKRTSRDTLQHGYKNKKCSRREQKSSNTSSRNTNARSRR